MDSLYQSTVRHRDIHWLSEPPVLEDCQAPVGCDPQTSFVILLERRNQPVWQTGGDRVVRKPTRVEAAESRGPRPNPHRPRAVLINRIDVPIDESLFFRVHMNRLCLQPVETLPFGAEPDVALSVFAKLRE